MCAWQFVVNLNNSSSSAIWEIKEGTLSREINMSLTFAQRGRPPPSPAQIQKVRFFFRVLLRRHKSDGASSCLDAFHLSSLLALTGVFFSTSSYWMKTVNILWQFRISRLEGKPTSVCSKYPLFLFSYWIVYETVFFRVEQILHRNLVYLASVADPAQNIQTLLPVSSTISVNFNFM